jgi:hypothetical protein
VWSRWALLAALGLPATSACGNTNAAASDAGVASTDAFPLSCGAFTFTLTADAQPGTCQFSPADIACDENADCVAVREMNCGCIDREYGANKASSPQCPAPPCAFVPDAEACDASGLGTEDCQIVQDPSDVVVKCIGHQCLTFAATSSENDR